MYFFLSLLFFYPLVQLWSRMPSESLPVKFFNLDISINDFSYSELFVILSYISIYSLFCLWLTALVKILAQTSYRYIKEKVSYFFWISFLFVCTVLVLELLNGAKYPNSAYSYSPYFSTNIFLEYLGSIFCFVIFVMILVFRKVLQCRLIVYTLLLCPSVLTVANFSLETWYNSYKPESDYNLTYVIGIDAIRSDAQPLLFENSVYLGDNHVPYNNAWSPVGRTYASWNVLTTGQTPTKNGVRFNLSSNEPKCTLFNDFSSSGWNVIYGSDEKRFNHIGEKCKVSNNIGSSTQALDFFAATSLDVPILNLLSGYDYLLKNFLPFHVNNRANYVTFDPRKSIRFYANKIKSRLKPGNNLMVFHFTLAHMPWTYRSFNDVGLSENAKYHFMVKEMGKNMDIFFSVFDSADIKRLSGVVWSDHGESFSNANESSKNVFCCSRVGGHGTSADILEQYNIFISFSNDIADNVKYSKDSFITSMDVYPTLSNWFSTNGSANMEVDGCNLLNITDCPLKRNLMLETGFTVGEMLSKSPDLAVVINQGIAAYQVIKGKVSLRQEFEKNLVNLKSTNVIHGVMKLK